MLDQVSRARLALELIEAETDMVRTPAAMPSRPGASTA